ncbi:transcription initiation factor IIA large subunit [Solanum tuberosum]|uniref:TFIIA n=1 Tax=Solanum tuberosum TaxID=4113 RepID=M1CZK9_SOLTU|nr:PREDICTED: transcription initiation factor IIA large subunit [Solanum tuberosum]XP_049409302.1 transcription initiation factor IIA large subunit-like [Solanum stenotomum]
MASSTTSNVYIHVIEDVISKVRDEFINNGGPGESILKELQALWEVKMMNAGAILGTIERNSAAKATPGGPITPVHDLNMPYEGNEEYETPTADILFPPTPLQTPLPGTAQTPLPGTVQTPLPGTAQTPLPGTADSSMYNIPTGGTPFTPSDYSPLNDTGGATELKAGPGRPSPFMHPPSPWLNQRPPLDVNVAYVEGREEVGDRGGSQQPMTQDFFMNSAGKRKREDFPPQYHNGGYIPQQDGAADSIYDNLKSGEGSNIQLELVTVGPVQASAYRIPQFDGPIPDSYDDALSTPNIYYQGVVNEDYNIVNTPAPNDMQAPTPAPALQNDDIDDDDEPLNEDDDDDLDDVDQGEDLNTAHLVLAQFDKVTRTKSRWKCTLKDGIMHINNKDILFNKANGEFDF